MTNAEFLTLDSALLKRAEEILNQRKGAYATEGDRFANFKEGAARSGITPLQVCHLYMQKGFSVLDKFAQGKVVPGETVEERFCDAINYIRLMYALYKENEQVLALKDDVRDAQRAIEESGRLYAPRSCGQAYEAASVSSENDEVAKLLDRRPQGYPGLTRVPGAKCETPNCNDTSVGSPLCNRCQWRRAEDGRRSFT